MSRCPDLPPDWPGNSCVHIIDLCSVFPQGGAVPGQSLMAPSNFFCATIPCAAPQSASLVASQVYLTDFFFNQL